MLIRGASWFDSARMEFFHGDDIRIEEGKIVEIGRNISGHLWGEGFSYKPRSDERVLDLAGMVILPGWIDAHVHLTLSGDLDVIGSWQKDGVLLATIKSIKYLERYLPAGVTVVRDLGGDADVTLALKKAINTGWISGPTILTAGHALTMTGGHIYQISREIDGVDCAKKGAREELKKGVDLLKVVATGGILTEGTQPGASQLSFPEMRAVVVEAHNAGRKVAAHAEGKSGIINALHAGVDTLEHGVGLDENVVSIMKNKFVALIPTLAAPRLILEHRNELPQQMVKKAEMIVEEHRASFALAYSKGVKIAIGTDAGTPFNFHGDYYREIEELLRDGMKVEEILQAASLNGAYALGLDEELGNIEIGKMANLTIIEDDLRNFHRNGQGKDVWYRNVKCVIKEGNVVIRSD